MACATAASPAPAGGAGAARLTERLAAFRRQAETFGYDGDPDGWWAHAALRLLLAAPRAYLPLVDAWDRRFPGSRRTLDGLVGLGFAEHQGPVVLDTVTGAPAAHPGPPTDRYRATARGVALAAAAADDVRAVSDAFPQVSRDNIDAVAALLAAFGAHGKRAGGGLSARFVATRSGLPERSVRWWLAHLTRQGLLRKLPHRQPDVREVVPAHWRPNRLLCAHLRGLLPLCPQGPTAVAAGWRLHRTRFPADIEPSRVAAGGATDYDHDVAAQRILALLLADPRAAPDGVFAVEPRITLPVSAGDPGRFHPAGGRWAVYQPDAEMREFAGGMPRRAVVEYERRQSRRDAWGHIERFVGWMATASAHPDEPGVLRFIVDSPRRARSYVELVEAFADYAGEHRDRLPPNPLTLTVIDRDRLARLGAPLDDRGWHRIALPEGTGGRADTSAGPLLHTPGRSPYGRYFSQGRR